MGSISKVGSVSPFSEVIVSFLEQIVYTVSVNGRLERGKVFLLLVGRRLLGSEGACTVGGVLLVVGVAILHFSVLVLLRH